MDRFWKYHLDHVLFWLITVGFHVYTRIYLIEVVGWWQFMFEIVLRNGLLALVIYANLEYLLPVLAYQQKWLQYLGGLAVCLAFYVLVKNTHDYYLSVFTGKSVLPFWRYSFYNFSIALFYMAFGLALNLSKEWYFQRRRLSQMELEKLQTELAYLKSQINPHFLFNSLNTIFFQIDKENAVARDTLTKFSDMLRYQLYECNGHEISLDREVSYLRNYMELQRLRKDERYDISFEVSGNPGGHTVAPLLFIPLVENAFKHLSHHPQGGNRVDVSLRMDDDIILTVNNTRDNRPKQDRPGGIGLRNLQRRLELQYPHQHELNINESATNFEVQLIIRK